MTSNGEHASERASEGELERDEFACVVLGWVGLGFVVSRRFCVE